LEGEGMKIVINVCFGEYSLSEKAYRELGIEWDGYGYAFDDDRANPALVSVVEKLGNAASGSCARLRVTEIPDGIEWNIDEYNGNESIEKAHRSWR
jgi:hypothetical protein